MKSTLVFCTAVCILLAGAVLTFGDIARPKESSSPVVRSKQIKSTLVIVPDGNAWDARLQISQESVRQLRAALDNLPADNSTSQSIAPNSTRTVMAGLFMFLAVSFGGVWLARSGHSRNQKALGVVVIAAALMGATAMITRGNAAPPPGWKWRDLSKNLNGGMETKGSVQIEIVPEGNGIKLIVPLYKVNGAAEKKPGE